MLVMSVKKSLLEESRGLAFFGRMTVELPISCRMPLDTLLSCVVALLCLLNGDTFSTSDESGMPLAVDQVLDDIDFGVTFRAGTAAPRKPAFRNCNLLACREVPGPDRGREGVFSMESPLP